MLSEKNLHHFCFWHPLSFDFYMVILSPGTNENFPPHRLKKIESSWPALRLIVIYKRRNIVMNFHLLNAELFGNFFAF